MTVFVLQEIFRAGCSVLSNLRACVVVHTLCLGCVLFPFVVSRCIFFCIVYVFFPEKTSLALRLFNLFCAFVKLFEKVFSPVEEICRE